MNAILAVAIAASLAFPSASFEPGFVHAAPGGAEAPGGAGFTLNGKPWRPFGCNYFDPEVGWAPKLWQRFDAGRVESHFRAMRELGVNVVRVFLTAGSFYREPPSLEPEALAKLDRLIAIARKSGIRVHPTGPDHWEGTPAWRRGDFYAEPKALEAQVSFWKALAARYRDEPAIFAWDLLNEPHVRWGGPAMEAAWGAWLREKYPDPQALRGAWGIDPKEGAFETGIPPDAPSASRRLLDYQRFRESVAERWVKAQVDAIRSVDPNHLVTVGLIQWSVPALLGKPSQYAAFRPSRMAPLLDFLTIHFYPLRGDPNASEAAFDANLAYLEFVLRCARAGDPAKPLLVGEFGWYGGGAADGHPERPAEDQARWCKAAVLQGRGIAAGWLNWAYADTPESRDCTKFSGLVTAGGAVKAWGAAFRELADHPESWASPAPAPAAEVTFDFDRAIVDPEAGDAGLAAYAEAWKAARGARLTVR